MLCIFSSWIASELQYHCVVGSFRSDGMIFCFLGCLVRAGLCAKHVADDSREPILVGFLVFGIA